MFVITIVKEGLRYFAFQSLLKPSGSLFSTGNPITPPSANSQKATSQLPTNVNTLTGNSIFGGPRE